MNRHRDIMANLVIPRLSYEKGKACIHVEDDNSVYLYRSTSSIGRLY